MDNIEFLIPGEKVSMLFSRIFDYEQQAIEFLKDKNKLETYLQKNYEQLNEPEGEIFQMRIDIPWFDCALSILEEISDSLSWKESIYQEAEMNLQIYCNDVFSQKNRKSFQENELVTNFLHKYSGGVIGEEFEEKQVVHAAQTTSSYKSEQVYTTFSLSIPIPMGNIEASVPIKFILSILWSEEKIWGKVKISFEERQQYNISHKQQTEFLHRFCIDASHIEENWQKNNISMDDMGIFILSSNLKETEHLKGYLQQGKIQFAMKLIVK